jgi:3-isopropylmalate/(R)-2-methylmalate dehydratase small subunit
MTPFTTLKGLAAPLPLVNVDTDIIIPKQFLKTIKRSGLGGALFHDLRQNPDFVLNTKPWDKAQILVAGANFGCGSSREHAPWALLDFGLRCIVAPSFADIFYGNCFKNGILPIPLPQHEVDALMEDAKAGKELVVNLPAQTITRANGPVIAFEIDPFRKRCLVEGLDDIGLTLQHEAAITAFEEKRKTGQPWI